MMNEANRTFIDLTTIIGKRRAVRKLLQKDAKKAQVSTCFIILVWGFVLWVVVNIANHVILVTTLSLVISVWLVLNIYYYFRELQDLLEILRMENKLNQIRELIRFGEERKLNSLEVQINDENKLDWKIKVPPYVENFEVSHSEHELANVRISYQPPKN